LAEHIKQSFFVQRLGQITVKASGHYFPLIFIVCKIITITCYFYRTDNYGEFATIRNQAGLNSFKISIKEFVEKTNAISLQAKAGRYGGTYAHKDIAFEFGMWISPEFKIYLVREFQRLKEDENNRQQLDWNLQRTLAKVNYTIHTDAIKERLIENL
jgi:hypothetical protein